MVDELHILLGNRTKKPLVIALSEAERELSQISAGGTVTNE
jgi:hypothetical protein